MAYHRWTESMTPAERESWWRRQAKVEGDTAERMGKAKTATGFSADKRRVTHYGGEWYKQGGFGGNAWGLY